jgi:hypothetical protein
MTLHKRPCDACVLPVSGVTRTYRPPSHLDPRGGEAVWTILGALAFGVELVDDLLAFFQGPVATVLYWQTVVSFTTKYSMLCLTCPHRAGNHVNHLASVVRRYVAFAATTVEIDDLADADASGCGHLAFVTWCWFAGGRLAVE